MTLSDLKQDKTDDAHLELGLREGEDSTAAPHPSGRRPDPPGGATLSAEAAAAREAELDDDDEADKEPLIKWRALLNWRTYAKRKYIGWYITLLIVIAMSALIAIKHKVIVKWMTPKADYLRQVKGGWLLPVVLLVVVSFPPLLGHELIAIVCGIVWGIWVGFGIVSAGTLLGEIANYFTFKYGFSRRAKNFEDKDLSYACLAHVIRTGGIWIALVVRYSAIPGHLSTTVFSTCGMSFFTFLLAMCLSMPKQLLAVWLGVLINTHHASKKHRIISTSVLVGATALTFVAAWWIWLKMRQARRLILRERRREARLAASIVPPSEIDALPSLSFSAPSRRPSTTPALLFEGGLPSFAAASRTAFDGRTPSLTPLEEDKLFVFEHVDAVTAPAADGDAAAAASRARARSDPPPYPAGFDAGTSEKGEQPLPPPSQPQRSRGKGKEEAQDGVEMQELHRK